MSGSRLPQGKRGTLTSQREGGAAVLDVVCYHVKRGGVLKKGEGRSRAVIHIRSRVSKRDSFAEGGEATKRTEGSQVHLEEGRKRAASLEGRRGRKRNIIGGKSAGLDSHQEETGSTWGERNRTSSFLGKRTSRGGDSSSS